MATLEAYLSQFNQPETIQIVGPLPSQQIRGDLPTILIDGGTRHREKIDLPTISMGDGDSTVERLDIQLSPDKDFSDLKACLMQLPPSVNKLYLNGFLGGRRDHELINLGEAHHFLLSKSEPAQMFFEDTVLAYTAGKKSLSIKGSFTLLSFQTAYFEISGDCRYQLTPAQKIPPLSSWLLSNQGHGQVDIVCDQPFFIFFN